ncbi:MAG: hypothetical protein HYV40_00730 [Candidatus Levybacteria bacterium]|nr:hypothetical protein [Candidatus Levybacteria bacterium]
MAADVFNQIAEKIIRAQETVIGPIALEQAKKVDGLSVDWSRHEVSVQGNKKSVLDNLIKQYEHLFGRASIEVCKDAVKSLISQLPKDQLPPSLA